MCLVCTAFITKQRVLVGTKLCGRIRSFIRASICGGCLLRCPEKKSPNPSKFLLSFLLCKNDPCRKVFWCLVLQMASISEIIISHTGDSLRCILCSFFFITFSISINSSTCFLTENSGVKKNGCFFKTCSFDSAENFRERDLNDLWEAKWNSFVGQWGQEERGGENVLVPNFVQEFFKLQSSAEIFGQEKRFLFFAGDSRVIIFFRK